MTSSVKNDIIHLLGGVKKTHERNKEIERLKGEKFNVFSILGLERNENRTHSALIAELLNPYGSHLKGTVFLDSFLSVVGIEGFDATSARVKVERHIGRIDRGRGLGGRIDIEIGNRDGRIISIENKIYAGDQQGQIVRYCRHNPERNTVLYLTLEGSEPIEGSKGKLEAGKDFVCISYKETILQWLQECLAYSVEDPILRESIRQYMILVKKLTGQLTDKKMEKELEELLWKSPKAAELISQNFPKMIDGIKNDFRDRVERGLCAILPNDFSVEKGNNVSKDNSQLWIRHSSDGEDWRTCYGIETFSGWGYFGGQLICGIMCSKDVFTTLPESLRKYDQRGGWIQYITIKDIDERDLDFADMEFLAKLGLDAAHRDNLVAKVVNQFNKFFNETKDDFLRVFKRL